MVDTGTGLKTWFDHLLAKSIPAPPIIGNLIYNFKVMLKVSTYERFSTILAYHFFTQDAPVLPSTSL